MQATNPTQRDTEPEGQRADVIELRDRQGRLYGKAFRHTLCVEIRRGNFVGMFDLAPLNEVAGGVLYCNSAVMNRIEG